MGDPAIWTNCGTALPSAFDPRPIQSFPCRWQALQMLRSRPRFARSCMQHPSASLNSVAHHPLPRSDQLRQGGMDVHVTPQSLACMAWLASPARLIRFDGSDRVALPAPDVSLFDIACVPHAPKALHVLIGVTACRNKCSSSA